MQNHALLCGAVIAILVGVSGCSSSDGGGSKASVSVHYLGLGDSIAYGEDGFIPFTPEARPNGDGFVGYPDLLGQDLFKGQYANLGCPGATTSSYLALDGEDNGCRMIQSDWLNTLHVQYTTTEADEADKELSMNDVKAITIGLGGNDLLLMLAGCSAQHPNDDSAAVSCALTKLSATIKTGAANLAQIFERLRDDGFTGELVYVNLYSTYLPSASATTAIKLWNTAMTSVVADANGQVADVFTAFADAAKAADGDPCAAGLLIPNPEDGGTPACDVHPSDMGAHLLADTVKALPGFGP